jgi:hypothetical protein
MLVNLMINPDMAIAQECELLLKERPEIAEK